MREILKTVVIWGTAGSLLAAPVVHIEAQQSSGTVSDLDPAVRTGTLANGLRYYVRANKKPENRAEFRLIVHAGSLQEDDDQRGLAHFLEHMAFNGTKHFPKQQLIDFLESTGMTFGAHLNAFTDFKVTGYQLAIPTDRPKNLDTALQILEDWAHNISLDPAEINLERGVVLSERRQRLGVGDRIMQMQLPKLYQGSKYVDRLPIGKPEIIQNAPPEVVRRFYRDWYRPDLMAVIVVGTFDPAEMEAKIKKQFSGLKNPTSPRAKSVERITINDAPNVSVFTDPEVTGRSMTIGFRDTMITGHTKAAERARFIRGLVDVIINERLAEVAQRPDAPFFSAGVSWNGLTEKDGMRSIAISLKRDNYVEAMKVVLAEVERAAQHGFLQSELGRQKTSYIRGLEQAYLERENMQSSSFAQAYSAHFLSGNPARSIVDEVTRGKELANSITLSDINAAAKYGFPKRGRMISVVLPEDKERSKQPPSADELLAVIDATAQQRFDPYTEAAITAPLLSSSPKPGTIVNEKHYKDLGITEWTLSNGARVVLKPTTFRTDDVILTAVSPGGLYMLADSDIATGQLMNTLVGLSGYGNLTRVQLQKRLAGTLISLRKGIDNGSESISGRSSPKDLDPFFQALYAMLTEPRYDSATIATTMQDIRISLENAKVDPGKAFSDTIQVTTAQYSPRHPLITLDLLNKVDPKRAIALYRERFASASDFLFVMVGAFTPATIKPFVEQYIASLPAGSKEEVPDRGVRPPPGVVKKVVYGGREPKSHSIVTYHGVCAADPQLDQENEMTQLSMLGEIMKHRLRIRLREELSGTYGVAVHAGLGFKPVCQFNLTSEFITAPERREEITKAFFDVINDLRTTGPTVEEVERVRAALLRNDETGMTTNEFWMRQLIQLLQVGWPLEKMLDQTKVKSMTPAMVHEAAKKFLPADNYMHFVLDPETVRPK